MRTLLLILLGVVVAIPVFLAINLATGPDPAEDQRRYHECIRKEIQAGSPDYQTTVARCEHIYGRK